MSRSFFLAIVALLPIAAARSDESVVRRTVDGYFTAYAAKDLDAFMKLWSVNSPELKTRRATMSRIFSETGPITLKELTIRSVKIEGDSARARVTVDLVGADKSAGTPHPDLGRLQRVLELTREGGTWKVWRYGPAHGDLARAFAAAKTEADREKLLAGQPELIEPPLVYEIMNIAVAAATDGQFAEAHRIIDLAERLAETHKFAETQADCHMRRGVTFETQREYDKAVEAFRKAIDLYREMKFPQGEARAIYNIGNQYNRKNRLDDAIEQFTAAAKLFEQTSDLEGQAACWNNLATIYDRTGRLAKAIEWYERALAVKRELRDGGSIALTLQNLGLLNEKIGQYQQAVAYYKEALKAAEAAEDRPAATRMRLALGFTHFRAGRYSEAERIMDDCLSTFRELKLPADESETLIDLAWVAKRTGRPGIAVKRAESALAIRRTLTDPNDIIVALNTLASMHRDVGAYGIADKLYTESVGLARRAGAPERLIDCQEHLALFYLETGRYTEARAAADNVVGFYRRNGNRAGEAHALNVRGNVNRQQSRNTDAEADLNAALAIAREIGSPVAEAEALNDRGNLYQSTGRQVEAGRDYAASIAISARTGDRRGEAIALGNLGNVWSASGRYADALRDYHRSLAIKRELGDPAGESSTLQNLAIIARETGQRADARRYYETALAIEQSLSNPAGEADILIPLGAMEYQAGTLDRAGERWRQALEIGRRIDSPNITALATAELAGLSERQGRRTEALRMYEQALTSFREEGNPNGQQYCLHKTGKLLEADGAGEAALARYREALKVANPSERAVCHHYIGLYHFRRREWPEALAALRLGAACADQLRDGTAEPILQTGLFDQSQGLFALLARAEANAGATPTDVLAAAERAKARTLIDILAEGKVDVVKGLSADERAEYRRLTDRISEYSSLADRKRELRNDPRGVAEADTQVDAARAERDAFLRRAFVSRPNLAVESGRYEPATRTDVARLFTLHPKLCVLSYLMSGDEVILFVVTAGTKPGGPASISIYPLGISEAELTSQVDEFVRLCSSPSRVRPDGGELTARLLGPAEDAIAAADHVVIVPEGPLLGLPFHALRTDDGKYLIEKMPVSYAPSVTALVKMLELGDRRRLGRKDAGADVLAVGLSDFAGRAKPLPQAEVEAQSVAGHFPGRGGTLLGPKATPARVRAAWDGCQFLHFATHGELNEASPFYSALMLAPSGPGDDGRLYARDLLDADVSAELVVLSACESGLGKRYRGEGTVGLNWAWFVAGVPSTATTLWMVDDAATAKLIGSFYDGLAAGRGKAVALRDAQLALINNRATRHPFYWAAFTLTGDWRD